MLEGEEESGSPNLVAIVRRHRDRLRADLCLCADAPKVDNRPTLVLGVRGIIHLHLSAANGQATGLHSGNYGNVVTNPALPLAALIERIAAAITWHAEAHDDFRRDALEQLIATDDPFLWPTTNINHLATEGTMLDARRLVIPRAAHAKIDVRLTPDTPPAAVASIAESLVEAHRRIHPALTFDLRVTDGKPASFTSPARPEYGWLHRLLADQGEGEVVVMPILGGTLPIWVFTDTLGIPTFVLPCANSDNQQHDASEHYIARHLPLQMGLFRRILDSLPDGSAAGAAMEASA
jgi:acetylornithine deacetylase/succinyl-diaminopimelate desuccinylase-like protein